MKISKMNGTFYSRAKMKFCPYFIYFLSCPDNIWYRRCPQWFNNEFLENQHTERLTLLRGMNEFGSIFYTLLPTLQQFGMKHLHIMLLSFVSYIRNWPRDGSTYLTGVKESHLCVHSNFMYILQLKHTLGQSIARHLQCIHLQQVQSSNVHWQT